VIELAGEGSDKVESSVSYVLPANVERLTLTGTALNGTGNSLANSIAGNSGANRIDGMAGADTMRGGTGDDVFVVDNWSASAATVDDTVIELSGGGTDTVESSVGFVLPSNVEKLILTGTAAVNGSGNFHANTITGNDGANILRGGANADTIAGGAGGDRIYGGDGNDVLKGDSGADGFYFDTALSAAGNVDKIQAYSPAADTIFLDRDVFTQILANGALAAAAFRSGPSAGDASDRIVYQQSTGKIFYDPDGTGPEAQILFATVTAGTALTSADFSAFI
jgi:Ca2+-binding RTX toxin-like protein